MKKLLLAGASLLALIAPANAVLIVEGISYSVELVSNSPVPSSPFTINFNLHITGINGVLDSEKGRYGVESFAFNLPTNFISATSPGYITELGGLNSSGCNGAGNFFCFNGPTPLPPALVAGSILDIPFSVTVTSLGDFQAYAPDFKINWVGTKNNYDLVSQNIGQFPTPTTFSVPGPLVGAGLPGMAALLGLLWFARRRGSIFC